MVKHLKKQVQLTVTDFVIWIIFIFFQNYAEILKKSGRERDEEHFIRYFKLRNSQIIKLEDHLFMGMKIEHLYIHDCSKYIHQ